MPRAIPILLVGLAVGLLAAVPAATAQSDAGAGRGRGRAAAWEELTPERRAELRRRYEALRAMDPAQRERTLARARRLRQEVEATLRSLTPAEREAIEDLGPAERARVVRELVADRARVMAARLRARMTDVERARLEDADADERARLLAAVKERTLAELPLRARRAGEGLGLSAPELERVSSGDPRERRAAMVALARRRAQQYVDAHGLPEGLGRAEWERIVALPDRAFARALHRVRTGHPEFAIPPRRWERVRGRREDLAAHLASLGTPSLRERARAPGAQEGALRRGAVLRHRGRIEDTLRRRLRLPAGDLARIQALDDDAFVRFHRQLVRELGSEADPAGGVRRWLERQGRAGDAGPGAERRRRSGEEPRGRGPGGTGPRERGRRGG